MEFNDKTIQAKQKLAQHRRGISGREVDEDYQDDRLPPGQHIVNTWPVLDLGYKPDIRLEDWRVEVDGLVQTPVTWNWEDFQAQPQGAFVSNFHCVTSWSQFEMPWLGVSFHHLLSIVAPQPEAKFVLFEGYDDYTTNLPLSVCDDDDVFLVHSWNGKSLSKDHGGPVRMIIPKRYAWKGAKWLKKITFTSADQKGFWEIRGYSNTALPWENDRYG